MEDENIPEFLNLIYFEQFSSIVVIADSRCASTYMFSFGEKLLHVQIFFDCYEETGSSSEDQVSMTYF